MRTPERHATVICSTVGFCLLLLARDGSTADTPSSKAGRATAGNAAANCLSPIAVAPGKDGKRVYVLERTARQVVMFDASNLVCGKDFIPLSFSGSTAFDLPLVFAGYGITGKAEKYDDYQGIDVAGKAVIVLRHQPRQEDSKSVFNGQPQAESVSLARKLANAQEHKAAAVIFCTDEVDIRKNPNRLRREWHEATERLIAEHEQLKKAQDATPEQIAAQCQRIEELARAVEAASKKVAAQCDPLLTGRQGEANTWEPDLPVVHCRRAALDRLVRATLGTDLRALERQIDQDPTPRSQLLPGWRAAGKTDIHTPQTELKNVVGVLDGTGPLADETIVVGAHYDHLYVMGSASGRQFAEMLDRLAAGEGLTMTRLPGGPGPSDEIPFYARNVPVIHFFTGGHSDYHRPSDTADKINVPGMRRAAHLAEAVVVELAKSSARPEFVRVAPQAGMAAGTRPKFGILPSAGGDTVGCGVSEVLGGGPAQRAGARSGDVVIELDSQKIGSTEEFLKVLGQHKAGDRVKTIVRREGEKRTLEVQLDPPGCPFSGSA